MTNSDIQSVEKYFNGHYFYFYHAESEMMRR